MKAPTLNSNILMLNFEGLHNVFAFIQKNNIEQFSVRPDEDGTLMLSVPVTKELEESELGIMHGARARAKEAEKPDPKPPTGGGNNPDGTPPNGGTPGSTSVWEDLYTEARAA